MNYNDEILDNKAFKFIKQLIYNIALAICILLVGVLIMVYGFKFRLYEVLSDSQAPYFVRGDMVVVRPQKEYKVGDIIKFDEGGLPTSHRLIAIVEENGTKYYVCHGDNNQNVDGTYNKVSDWKDDVASFNKLFYEDKMTLTEIEGIATIQTPTANQVEGKVLFHFDQFGTYMKFIKEHSVLVIIVICGIWGMSYVVQNEIELRKNRRFV